MNQEKTDVLIFNVGLGQSIFIYPHSNHEYGMLVDCGNTPGFEPIDFLLKKRYVTGALKNLALTNYDEDHFSGLPYLKNRISISTVYFPKNLTSAEIKGLKQKPFTEALEHTCQIRDSYTSPTVNYAPPYAVKIFHLEKHHLEKPSTNNLSQVIFIEHYNSVICISGDLEAVGWETLLKKDPEIKIWLAKTNIFIASHHGRENGYSSEIFKYCKPECVVISDKTIMHSTQETMSSVYGKQVAGNGIVLNNDLMNRRKVLTTREDGHIFVQFFPTGSRIYGTFNH